MDEDIGVGMDFDLQVEAQLNANPLVAGPGPSPPIAAAGTSSSQPRHKRIAHLSQAQRASATTSIVPVEDLDEEEPWVHPSD